MTIFSQKFKTLIFSAILLMGFGGSFSVHAKEVKILAVINGEVITSMDLETSMKRFKTQIEATKDPQGRARLMEKGQGDLLQELIRDRLLNQEMKALGIAVSPQEVDDEIERDMARFGINEAVFRQELAHQGMTLEQYRKTVEEQLRLFRFIGRKIRPRVTVTDSDVKKFYDQNSSRFVKSDQVFLIRLQSPAPIQGAMREHLEKILGENPDEEKWKKEFPKIVKIDLGVLKLGDLDPAMAKTIKNTPVKTLTETQKSERGFWVAYFVKDRLSGETARFEDVQDEVRLTLMNREIDREMNLYIDDLREKAHIEIRS